MRMTVEDFSALREAGQDHLLLDVREPWEVQTAAISGSLNIPMRQIPEHLDAIPADKPVVVMCHHGMRSMTVVNWLRAQGRDNAVNLDGGIDLWSEHIDPAVPRY